MTTKKKVEETTKKKVEVGFTDVVKQMQDDGCEFFVNSKIEPTVTVPDDGFQQDWPADSQRVQDLIHSLYHDLSGGEIMKSSDASFLMALIREECRKGGRRLSQAETSETDKDVLVQTMLVFVNKHESYEGRTLDLLGRFREIHGAGYVDVSEDIPVFVNIFSRRLRRLIPMLRGYGVEVVITHKEDGSRCTVKRLDNFEAEPADGSRVESSGESSDGTSDQGKDLPLPDDSDGTARTDSSKSSRSTKGGAK